MSDQHVPVLLEETLALLAPGRGGCFVDCTLGLGGHAEALLERDPDATLIGIDRDPEALQIAAQRLARFEDRVRLLRGAFANLETLLLDIGMEQVHGILADIGVSSLQLDRPDRGFSFRLEGPLDMRMGSGDLTASDIINGYPEDTLVKILKDYGEEPQARRIARAVVERRQERPLETTGELRQLIETIKRPRGWSSRGGRQRRIHPATQTFQALRIEVNQELEELRSLLDQSVRMLERQGHLVVISYHSLEDRMVKHTLRDFATGEIEPITGRPRAETQVIEVLTRKPVRPGPDEIARNPRSRSARLRAARRI